MMAKHNIVDAPPGFIYGGFNNPEPARRQTRTLVGLFAQLLYLLLGIILFYYFPSPINSLLSSFCPVILGRPQDK